MIVMACVNRNVWKWNESVKASNEKEKTNDESDISNENQWKAERNDSIEKWQSEIVLLTLNNEIWYPMTMV